MAVSLLDCLKRKNSFFYMVVVVLLHHQDVGCEWEGRESKWEIGVRLLWI